MRRRTNADGSEQFEVTHGSLGALLGSPDRTVRRTAWESYADGHLAYKNTMANALAAGVKQDVFRARARRYDSSLEAALTPPNIPTAVFHNLIETFRKNLPTWHRYWRLRRKVLGVETLHEYDIKAPLTHSRIDVPYRQAVDWICEGMAPLGEEYVRILRRGALEERWVDIYPNKGKRLGAFSYGGPGTHPFIMMSYNDDVFSLSTLAHELGHSLHSYYSWRTQPMIYGRYTLFAAEVASNFNQALVRDYLLRTKTDRDFQIALIEEAMSNFHRYFFIMPTLARFELELHERVERGQPLTSSAHDRADGRPLCRRLRRRPGHGSRAHGHHLGAVLHAPVLELLRLPVCDGHFGRQRAGGGRTGRQPRARSTATWSSCTPAVRSTRSMRCSRPGSTSARRSRWTPPSRCWPTT